MPAAELAFGIFFIACTLALLLDPHLVVGKLWNILRAGSGHFASRQKTYPRSSGHAGGRIRPNGVIVTETCELSSEQCGCCSLLTAQCSLLVCDFMSTI